MTFLTTKLGLKQPLTSREMQSLGRLTTVYGIRSLAIDNQILTVTYDASRIHEAEVAAEVRKAGIAAETEQPISPGGFDSNGEFRDFAWPTQGLSPANKP
jgi:hypothetical protein